LPISSVAMAVEGVLQKNVSMAPIPVGVALYHSLKANFNILLYSESDRKALDYWLSLEALNDHAAAEYNEDGRWWLSEVDRKITQVNSLRQRGFHIDLVIEPDPLASSYLLKNGYSVLTFTHAQYAMPQWRPDYTEHRKPWEEFELESRKMAELRALDERLKKSDERDSR
jgi:hypothetical protein